MFDLVGTRAVVTGAGAGLGRAFALALSRGGAETICVDIDPAGLDETLAALRAEGGSAFSVTADLAVPHGAEVIADAIASTGGRLDVLVNNAGIATAPGRTHEITVSDWDRALAVNLRSMFLVTRALLPAMMSTEGGSIINISSFLGLVGAYPGFPVTAIPYAASKAGVVGFTRQLAAEYAPEGIRANAIAPGWHAGTNLGRERRASATPEQAAKFDAFINGSVPLGRRGTPQDLDGLIVYLASDASSYMTGQVFAHDGGLTAV